MTELAQPETGGGGSGSRGRKVGFALVATLVLVALVNLMLFLRVPGARRRGGRATSGAPAPAFRAPLLGGGQAALADFRGKVVLLDFWATWCGPCVREMPQLDRLQRRLSGAGRPFTVLGINVEGHDHAEEAVASFARGTGLSFPIVLDDGSVARQYGVDTIPYLVLVDRDGQIRETFAMPASDRELAEEIEPLF